MTIVTELVNGTRETFKSDNYTISAVKDFHPLLLSVKVYANGKLIAKRSRRFKWIYKHVTFKSAKVQDILRAINEQKK